MFREFTEEGVPVDSPQQSVHVEVGFLCESYRVEDYESVCVMSAGFVKPELAKLLLPDADVLIGAQLFWFGFAERVNDEDVLFEFRRAFGNFFFQSGYGKKGIG